MQHVAGQWAIDKDYLAEPGSNPGTNANAVGRFGPRRADLTFAEIIAHPDSKRFRMKGDDDDLFYEGACFLPDGLTGDAFRPLDDFGAPNAGATTIEYENTEKGGWEPL